MKKYMRIPLITLVIGVLIFVYGLSTHKTKSLEEIPAIKVEINAETISINADGNIEALLQAVIYPEINAKVKEVKVEQGSKVKAGDVLAVLDDTELQRKVREERSNYYATIENKKAIQEGPDDNEHSINQAQHQINSAKERYDKAVADLEKAKVKAPISGEIVDVNIIVDQNTNFLEAAFAIVNPDKVQVKLNVSEDEIIAIKPGMKVSITMNTSEEVYEGKVKSIVSSPVNLMSAIYYPVVVEVSEIKNFKVGMSLNADIEIAAKTESVELEEKYILKEESGSINVFKLDKQTNLVSKHSIEAEEKDGKYFVKNGLNDGDYIVEKEIAGKFIK